MEQNCTIRVAGLAKSYRGSAAPALRDVSFTCPAGQVTGLLGPNGAGKTTILSCVAGLMEPDSGSAQIIRANGEFAAARDIGGVLDQYGLFGKLTVASYVSYVAALYGIDRKLGRFRATALLEALEIDDIGKRVDELSTGSRKKVALAAALIHGPSVLLLDEPLETVDPIARATIESVLRRFARAGGTILMSTHDLDLVQRVCDRVVMMARGQVVEDTAVSGLAERGGLTAVFSSAVGIAPRDTGGLSWLW